MFEFILTTLQWFWAKYFELLQLILLSPNTFVNIFSSFDIEDNRLGGYKPSDFGRMSTPKTWIFFFSNITVVKALLKKHRKASMSPVSLVFHTILSNETKTLMKNRDDTSSNKTMYSQPLFVVVLNIDCTNILSSTIERHTSKQTSLTLTSCPWHT